MFFDVTNAADLLLLPVALRTDEDIAAIAEAAEADVLAHYTGVIPSSLDRRGSAGVVAYRAREIDDAYALDAERGLYVFLRDYNPTLADCEPLLAAALRREIADVVRWRHAQWRAAPLAASEAAHGGKSTSYREDRNRRFHESFGVHLRPFDIRPPAAVV